MTTPAQKTAAQRTALDAGEIPPPWWKPVVEQSRISTRQCLSCDVRWVDDDACWMCGEKGSRT